MFRNGDYAGQVLDPFPMWNIYLRNGGSQNWSRYSNPDFDAILNQLAVFADLLAPCDPLETFHTFFRQPPSLERPLGNDHLGRDILSRIIVGTRTSLYVAFVSVLISKLIGVTWGLSPATKAATSTSSASVSSMSSWHPWA